MKKMLCLIINFILIIGTCSCANSKQETENKINSMQAFVENKYNKEFEYEYFVEARDETYTNILSLSDGDVVFNVYKDEPEDIFYDNYNIATLNKKFINFTKNKNDISNSDIEIYSNIILSGDDPLDYSYVTSNTIDEIIKKFELMKIILIIKTSDVEANKQPIFELYKFICSLNPKYIDLQIIEVNETSENLEKMLNNLPGLYSDNWDEYKEVKSYVNTYEKDISTQEILFKDIIKK